MRAATMNAGAGQIGQAGAPAPGEAIVDRMQESRSVSLNGLDR
jgi:hypothetical protein